MSDDMISKFEAIDRIDTYFCVTCHVKKEGGACGGCMIKDAKEIISDTNAVDAEPVRHGVWKHDGKTFKGGVDWYHCSECNCAETGVYVFHPYCSMCGAKMEIEK